MNVQSDRARGRLTFENVFETQVVMDNSPDRHSWKIQLFRDFSG